MSNSMSASMSETMSETLPAGRLTTHVLDTALGAPAAKLALCLYALQGGARTRLLETITNADGRTDAPLLQGDGMKSGVYELEFCAGAYLRAHHAALLCTHADTAALLFLDIIPIRFGIKDASRHYHVPLLLAPFGYSTYRGS